MHKTGSGGVSEGANTQNCPTRPLVVDWGALLMTGCQVITHNAWPCTMASNVFVECHAPCSLNNSFVDFAKE